MTDYKTINGHDVKTHEHRNHRVPQHAREFCGRLDRAHPAVDRIDYNGFDLVSVWMNPENTRAAFKIPDGWRVVTSGVYSGGVCIDLEREA